MSKEVATPFTKGEWYLQKFTDAYTNIIRCNNGKDHETLFIASTPQSSLPEARANARLMAAAPDLLICLIDYVENVLIDFPDNDERKINYKAAIAKAINNTNEKTGINE